MKVYPPTRNFKVMTFQRVLSAAAGNVAYTGVGFKPKAILFFAGKNAATSLINSIGITDGTTTGDVGQLGASAGMDISNVGYVLTLAESGTAYQNAALVSLDNDGFTLQYFKTGAPTSTVNVFCLCFG